MALFRIPSFGSFMDDWSPLMSEPQGIMVVNPFRGYDLQSRQKAMQPASWVERTNMPEVFEPEDITMKIEGDQVLIHGVHTYGTKESGSDKIESSRVVKIPESVERDSVKLAWIKGNLVVKGAWKKTAEEEADMSEGNARDIPITMKEGGQQVALVKKPLKMDLNLSHYKPEEIRVRVAGDKLVVTAEQQAEDDTHFHAQQFSRVITIPDYVDASSLKSTLGEDGVLRVTAPLLPQIEQAQASDKKEDQPMEAEAGDK